MGRRGPPRKPTALKLLHGTYRVDRAPQNEPQPELVMPKPPKHLSPLAREEWALVSEELYGLGLLSRIDRAALAAYCEFWADWVEASERCSTTEDGRDRKVMQLPDGSIKENPYYGIKKRAAELMYRFIIEFGMSPASRSRINVANKSENTSNHAGKKDTKNFA